MKRKIKPNDLILYSVIFSVAFITGGFILQYNTEQITRRSLDLNSRAVASFYLHNQVQDIIKNVIVIESKVRGFVITGDEEFIQGVQDTLAQLKYKLISLKDGTREHFKEGSFALLVSLIDKKITSTNDIITTYYRDGQAAAREKVGGKAVAILSDSILDLSRQLERELYDELQKTLEQNKRSSNIVLTTSRLLTVLSLTGIVLLTLWVVRHLRRQHSLILELEQANEKETAARVKIEKISEDIQDLYNNAPCGYHSLDADARFIAINDTELKWLGYTRDEVVGKLYIYDVLDKASAAIVREYFPRYKERGVEKERRLTMVTRSGDTFPILLNSIAVYDEAGLFVSGRSTIFDITEQIKIETALKEAKQKADESAIIKEQFLANMSHEIRTPINSVIGFTNLLQKTMLNPDQKQFVNLIQSAGESLLTIINDILDISKMEAGMLRIEKHPFSLRGLCNSVETMFYHKAREKNLSFSIYIQENIPDTLTGDAVRLTQVLVNLISNAIKFTQKGGIAINITSVKTKDDFARLRFSVKDSGIGIPPDKLDSVFERFQQGETDTTRKYGGTGLGLAIVKNLIDMQGGSITVESETGKGTEFVFEIEYSILPVGQAIPTILPEKQEIGTATFPNAKILVVEDNPMNQLLIKYTFQSWQIQFEVADNGQKAIDWLQQAPFDLVLLDIQMPTMDGYLTAQTIRNELKNNIPIIAMTAHAMAGEREKCLSFGMNDYISKPIHEKELYTLLKSYLAKGNENLETLKDDLHYIDLNFLHDMVMGDGEFLKTIIKQFLKQFPGEMEALKNAVDQKNYKQTASLAHHIQSTVSVMGKNTPFFQQLEKLEKLAKKNAEPATLTTAFNKLHDYRQQLLQEVNHLLNSNAL